MGTWKCISALALCASMPACASNVSSGGVVPGEDLPGGDTTNTLLLGSNAFSAPAENIRPEVEALFFSGNALFNQPWVEAPSSTKARDGLGPLFNARGCTGCHFKDGRGAPPLEGDPLAPDGEFTEMLLRISVGNDVENGPVADATYGAQLQPFSNPGVPAEGTPRVTYTELDGQYEDGESYTLLDPTYAIDEPQYGDLPDNLLVSPRVAPAIVGLGLLEAIPVRDLEDLADPDDRNADGISGRPNWVPHVLTGNITIGRFGWKAEQPTVRQQSAGAFLGDMGLTTSMFPAEACTKAQTECNDAMTGGSPEVEDRNLDRMEAYASLLAVPLRTNHAEGSVLRGKRIFNRIGCASCHTPSHQTGSDAKFEEVRDQFIWPYTDLLLHDMGDALSDNRPSYAAEDNEWRTAPLWGLRFIKVVNGHDRLLHDGRARGVAEAILWHGGEGEQARNAFKALRKADREFLIEFVESL